MIHCVQFILLCLTVCLLFGVNHFQTLFFCEALCNTLFKCYINKVEMVDRCLLYDNLCNCQIVCACIPCYITFIFNMPRLNCDWSGSVLACVMTGSLLFCLVLYLWQC